MDVCNLVSRVLACASRARLLAFSSNLRLTLPCLCGIGFFLRFVLLGRFRPGPCRMIAIGIRIKIRPIGSWRLSRRGALPTAGVTAGEPLP